MTRLPFTGELPEGTEGFLRKEGVCIMLAQVLSILGLIAMVLSYQMKER